MKTASKVAIKQPEPPAEELSTEVIASALVSISDGIKKLRAGSLNDRALVLLIQHAMPQAERPTGKQIRAVLDAAEGLKNEYLKKQPK